MLRRTVLIFHSAALGDFILSWPVAAALGRLFAQSRIVYVTTAQKGRLAERVLGVEWTDVEAGWHALHGDATLPERAAAALAGAHTVVSFVARAGEPWEANVARQAPEARRFLIDPRPSAGLDRSIAHHLIAQIPDTVLRGGCESMLKSFDERGTGRRGAPGDDIVIHPGSGSLEKCWPLDRFRSLIVRLKSAGRRVKVVAGEVERERLGDAVATLPADEIIWPATLVDLHAHVTAARTFIGNDSGPTHLAGVCGVSTVALFGPTNPAVWRPLGPHVKLLRAGSMDEISVGDVLRCI